MKYKGSFTIEAALIIPMILGVIVLFIYLSMYAHDRCVLEYAAVSGADAGVPAGEQILSKQLILDWDTNISAYTDEDIITVKIEAVTPLTGSAYVHEASAYKHFRPNY